jgi:hypothetical protein
MIDCGAANKTAGEVLTAKQAPHRPGITPALSLRADGDDVFIIPPAAGTESLRCHFGTNEKQKETKATKKSQRCAIFVSFVPFCSKSV